MHAIRAIKLCTKDCLCLYVCPTGATDTENGQIDTSKCIGCGVCAKACPSGAITMMPNELPPQQKKDDHVVQALLALSKSKTEQESIATAIVAMTDDPISKQFAQAISRSNRIMAEDIIRESGYMLPQSNNTYQFLLSLLASPPDDFPVGVVQQLLDTIHFNELPEEKVQYRCKICGHIHDGALPDEFKCPICQQPASVFEKI